MPAVTVDDVLALPRVEAPDPAAGATRPVISVTTAPAGFEGEGFPVRRAFAGVDRRYLDPFIHMDQMGEVEYAPGEPKGTPWHPHRGFETVTYMIDGTFQHQDSIGGGGLITNGDTQWMTAGGGILHIEAPPEELVASGGLFHGIQLWVNLPKADKMIAPRYQDIGSSNVELLTSPDGGSPVPGDRRRARRSRRTGLDPLAHGHGARHPLARGPGWTSRGGATSTPWSMCWAAGAPSGPTGMPVSTGQLAVFGDGDSLTVAADADQESRTPNAGCPDPRRPTHPRAGLRLRPVRDEHQGRGGPGVRGLPGRAAGDHPGRPHRVLTRG